MLLPESRCCGSSGRPGEERNAGVTGQLTGTPSLTHCAFHLTRIINWAFKTGPVKLFNSAVRVGISSQCLTVVPAQLFVKYSSASFLISLWLQ